MQCTPNELLALLKRALDALPGRRLDTDAVAHNVVELERLGLDGVHPLLQLFSGDRNTPAQEVAVTIDKEGTVHMAGASLLAWAPQIIDQAMCRANPVTTVTLRIDSARDPLGLLPELMRSDRSTWCSAELSWPEKTGGRRCLLRLDADTADPWLGQLDEPTAGKDRPDACIRLTLVGAAAGKHPAATHGARWSVEPDAFASRREEVLTRGLDIDDHDWETLNRLADRVLVESNDRSRRGAGE